jgi:hypothetical protein
MTTGEGFYKNISGWILHAAMYYPETKLTDVFIFSNNDGKLELNFNNALFKEWKDAMTKEMTRDLSDPEALAKWKAWCNIEKDYLAALGLDIMELKK